MRLKKEVVMFAKVVLKEGEKWQEKAVREGPKKPMRGMMARKARIRSLRNGILAGVIVGRVLVVCFECGWVDGWMDVRM
jgi:hypothetical protein